MSAFDRFSDASEAYVDNPSMTNLAALLRTAREAESEGELSDEGFLDTLATVQDALDAQARMKGISS